MKKLFTAVLILLIGLLFIYATADKNKMVPMKGSLLSGNIPGQNLMGKNPMDLKKGNKEEMLQVTSGGHVLGFKSGEMYIAAPTHMLKVEYSGANKVEPFSNTAINNKTDRKAAPLNKVTYKNLWDQVDLVYDKTDSGVFKSTYYVEPSEDREAYKKIRLKYNVPVKVDKDGSLVFSFETGQLKESKPIAWQIIDGKKVFVKVDFIQIDEREIGFKVMDYDLRYRLEIDPELTWNTFLGSSNIDYGYAITVDQSGYIYITGHSSATWGTPINAHSGIYDTFIAKLGTNGNLIWNTFLPTDVRDIILDNSGNIYIAGYSISWGTPINPHSGSGGDICVAKLNNSGNLQWNTFFGSTGSESVSSNSLSCDGSSIYICGASDNTWGTPINPHSNGTRDAFVVKMGSNGSLQWNTFFGSSLIDAGIGSSIDNNGNVYCIGYSQATWGTPLNSFSVTTDAWVVKLNSSGLLQWSTFVGGSGFDSGYGIEVAESDNIYIVGRSGATWGTPVNAYSGGQDFFVAKLSSSGTIQWSTFLGYNGDDNQPQIKLDSEENIFIGGTSLGTWGTPIYTHGGIGYPDKVVAKLNNNGSLLWHTYFGTRFWNNNTINDMILDNNGNVFVIGNSQISFGTPINAHSGSRDIFVAKLSETNINLKQNTTDIPNGGSYDYGSNTNGTNTDIVFTIENTGESDLTLTTPISITGINADQFSIQNQPTSPVTAGSSTTFTVRFSPDSAGAKTAAISIANNDSDENPYDLTLNGTGLLPTYTISGNAGTTGATLNWNDGGAQSTTSDGSGNYTFTVSYNWSGTVTPSLSTYAFSPSSRTYTNIVADQTSQDYVATLNLLPIAITTAASGISTSGGILNGTVNANSISTVVTFEYGKTQSYGTSVSATPGTVTGSSNTTVSHTLTGLVPNTTYHYRAVGVYATGTTYGADMIFKTKGSLPIIQTKIVTDISSESAISGGKITSDGDLNITARGICWSKSNNPTLSDDHTDDGTGSGSFTSKIENLNPDTKYYVRAYATNWLGTAYGQNEEFMTLFPLPTIKITKPEDQEIVYGNVIISAESSVPANPVEFFIDDTFLGYASLNTEAEHIVSEESLLTLDITGSRYIFIDEQKQLKKLTQTGEIKQVFNKSIKVEDVRFNNYGEIFLKFTHGIKLEDNKIYKTIAIDFITKTLRVMDTEEQIAKPFESAESVLKDLSKNMEQKFSYKIKTVACFDVAPDEYILIGNKNISEHYSIISTSKSDLYSNHKVLAYLKEKPVKLIKNTFLIQEGVQSPTLFSFPNTIINDDASDDKLSTYIIDWETINFNMGTHRIKVSALDEYNRIFSDEIKVFVRHIKLILNAKRKNDNAYTFKIHLCELKFQVINPKEHPVSKYVIYRKVSGGEFTAIKQIEEDGDTKKYMLYDSDIKNDISYIYKVVAYNSDGEILSESREQSI